MEPHKKLMWIVENTANHPLLNGYDAAFIELWSHGDNGLRKYIIDGDGTLWFPSVETAQQAVPMGRLMLAIDSECDSEMRKRAITFCGLEGKKVMLIAANDK